MGRGAEGSASRGHRDVPLGLHALAPEGVNALVQGAGRESCELAEYTCNVEKESKRTRENYQS